MAELKNWKYTQLHEAAQRLNGLAGWNVSKDMMSVSVH